MGKPNSIKIGDVFGRLTVIDIADPYIDPKTQRKRARYLCECSCSAHTQKIVSCSDLSSGRVKSCGCLQKDAASINGKHNTTHGLSKTKIMQSYYNMHKKCIDENIPLCNTWNIPNNGAQNFYNDMISTYSDGSKLVRIDETKEYDKNNCIWIDRNQDPNKFTNAIYFLD